MLTKKIEGRKEPEADCDFGVNTGENLSFVQCPMSRKFLTAAQQGGSLNLRV
jgi:hypothetical protein